MNGCAVVGLGVDGSGRTVGVVGGWDEKYFINSGGLLL